jgi:hypothetical protein
MLVASDNLNSIGSYKWEKVGDKGAIEVPYSLAADICNRPGGQYWVVNGNVPAAPAEPEAQPEVELKEDESTGDDIADALDASNVGTRPKTRSRKTTPKE